MYIQKYMFYIILWTICIGFFLTSKIMYLYLHMHLVRYLPAPIIPEHINRRTQFLIPPYIVSLLHVYYVWESIGEKKAKHHLP